jgi:hypothetical protein
MMTKDLQNKKSTGGKKAKFGTPEEMQKKIDEYFKSYENPEPLKDPQGFVLTDKQGNPVFKNKIPTSSGLAYHLGFNSRCSFSDYLEKPTFADVIKKARLRLQMYWEPELNSKNAQGVKYFLSNINDGWREPEENKALANNIPVIAQIVFIDQKGKYAKPSDIPVIDAEVIEPKQIKQAKPRKASKTKATEKANK